MCIKWLYILSGVVMVEVCLNIYLVLIVYLFGNVRNGKGGVWEFNNI